MVRGTRQGTWARRRSEPRGVGLHLSRLQDALGKLPGFPLTGRAWKQWKQHTLLLSRQARGLPPIPSLPTPDPPT